MHCTSVVVYWFTLCFKSSMWLLRDYMSMLFLKAKPLEFIIKQHKRSLHVLAVMTLLGVIKHTDATNKIESVTALF